MTTKHTLQTLALATLAAAATACSTAAEGLAPSQPADTTVKVDFFHRPFPDMPLPNDLATRYDATSSTGRRINASMTAPTGFEARVRELLDHLDGWGVFQPIVIPFTGALDVASIVDHHRQADYDTSDDVVYLINVDPRSPALGTIHHLDLGNGNYPVVLEDRDKYWKNDPRGSSISLGFEETSEDRNGNGELDPGEDANGNGELDPGEDKNENGVLDPPEDTDADGILDVANYLPGAHPAADDLAGRSDALMTFYDRLTNTLVLRPMVPLAEGTTYAVVVTRRLLDAEGKPVGSPYPFINHTSQTIALTPLLDVLPDGLAVDDIAFAFSFTTQTVTPEWKAVRDGLYEHGVQKHLGKEFPAEVSSLLPLRDASAFPDMKKPHLMYGEVWKPALEEVAKTFLGGDPESANYAKLVEGTGYVDYYVVGSYESPQLFPRADKNGKTLGLNDQSWPKDVDKTAAEARSETVYFTLAVPRKEVSARGEGKPVPLVMLGHGYTGNRFDVWQFASYLCRHGVAVIGIDGPSHGIGTITPAQASLVKIVLGGFGVGAAGDAVLIDRAFDQNNDGQKDSGADFWSAYLFHTRDIVRQFAVDYMQLVRIAKSFDGSRKWAFDTNGDGAPDLAGDFDGDGAVDIGGDAKISMTGGSLGGIMSMIMGAVEPGVTAIAPISGGGGFSDIGIRSRQGGVAEAFILRVLGPLYTGTVDLASGDMTLETIIPDLNDTAERAFATVKGVSPWDSVVVENLVNGKRGCGFVSPEGTVRVSVESDVGDPTRILVYKGPQLLPSETCEVRSGAKPMAEVSTFEQDVEFQGTTFAAGTGLVALAEGLGLRRGHPDLRRFQGLGQIILDRADPAVLAPHLQLDPLSYAATGEVTGSHALVITSMGDMNVPANSGATYARAAGLIEFLKADSRYGKPVNQELIDTFTMEAVHSLKRFTDPAGNGVHLDVENFSQGTDMYGTDVPRLDKPLRIGWNSTDALGGKSAAIFPYNVPEGQHGFDLPGGMTDKARQKCKEACMLPDDGCGCSTLSTFDIGNFMMNMIGRYLASDGKVLSDDLCQSSDDCADLKPMPKARDVAELK